MISIVIPVHNDPENLRKCLKSVFKSSYSDYECIVVDDASTDETLSVAREFPVKVITLSENSGPALGRNQGAKAASGDILFFTDADIQIYPDTLSKIAESFETHPQIDAVIGSYDDEPASPTFISQYKNLFHHYVHQNSNVNTNTFWAACGAIRRTIFLKFGGFDERYAKPAIEDIELGHRLAANNHKILLQKGIQVKHLKRWTLWSLIKTDIFQRGIPWTELMLENKIFPDDLNLGSSQRFCVILVYLLLLSLMIAPLLFGKDALLFILVFPLALTPIVLVNSEFYKFFLEKRNIRFAVRVFPLHVIYYFYCGLGFLLGVSTHVYNRGLQKMQRQVKTPALSDLD